MKRTMMAVAASLCLGLAACGEREETVTENIAQTVGVEAGGAAEAGRPAEVNVGNAAEPTNEAANSMTNTAAEQGNAQRP